MALEHSTLLLDRPLTQVAGGSVARGDLAVSRRSTTKSEPVVRERVDGPGPQRWRDLQACVATLLESNCGVRVPTEKRTHRRYAFRRPLTITPVDASSGRPDKTKSFAAFGFDISSAGISFLARQLVPAQRAVVTCEGPNDQPTNLLFEPRWVRFTRGGWYQTGGRLLEVLSDQTPHAPNLRLLEPPDLDEMAETR